MTKPIEVYFWPTPNGHKITIALEEMGLPYEIKLVNIGKGEQFTPEFLAISPNNRVPAIIDHDGPGGQPISIFESGAILQYLGRKTGQFYPSDERARIKVDEWLIWQVANLGPMAGQASHFINYAPKIVDDPQLIEYGRARYVNELNRLCGVVERQLESQDFLAGEYSIADIASWPWLRGAHRLGQTYDGFPKMKAWIDRIYDRPAVMGAVKKGEALREQQQELSKDQVRDMAKNLFGQTAASVNASKSNQS